MMLTMKSSHLTRALFVLSALLVVTTSAHPGLTLNEKEKIKQELVKEVKYLLFWIKLSAFYSFEVLECSTYDQL